MRLLLMRHAAAVAGADDDPGRDLLPPSVTALQQPSADLAERLAPVSRVVSSPWLRARRTAELLLPFCAAQGVELTDALLPGADTRSCLDYVETLFSASEDAVVLAVGHQPLLGHLAALLCEGAHAAPFALAPGELAVIELDWPAAGLGTLRGWLQL